MWTGFPNSTLSRRLQWRDGSWGNRVLLTAKSNIWATMASPFFFFFKLGSARLSIKCPGHCIGDQCSLLEPHSAQHTKILVVSAAQGTGLCTLGEDSYTRQAFLVHTPRAIFLSAGLVSDSS